MRHAYIRTDRDFQMKPVQTSITYVSMSERTKVQQDIARAFCRILRDAGYVVTPDTTPHRSARGMKRTTVTTRGNYTTDAPVSTAQFAFSAAVSAVVK